MSLRWFEWFLGRSFRIGTGFNDTLELFGTAVPEIGRSDSNKPLLQSSITASLSSKYTETFMGNSHPEFGNFRQRNGLLSKERIQSSSLIKEQIENINGIFFPFYLLRHLWRLHWRVGLILATDFSVLLVFYNSSEHCKCITCSHNISTRIIHYSFFICWKSLKICWHPFLLLLSSYCKNHLHDDCFAIDWFPMRFWKKNQRCCSKHLIILNRSFIKKHQLMSLILHACMLI